LNRKQNNSKFEFVNMNPGVRIKRAMSLAVPDKVPLWCPLSLEHIISQGSPEGKIPETVEQYITIECGLTHTYRFDGALLMFPALSKGADMKSILEQFLYRLPAGGAEHDFSKADPESWPPAANEFTGDDFYSSRLAREIVGENIHLGGWIPDGFSKAIQWFPNLEEAMVALKLDPGRFQALIKYFDEWCTAHVRAQIALGKMESIQISSPYAGAGFISRGDYEQFVLPSVKRIANAIRIAGAFSYVHTCGHISDRLDLIAQSGTDGIECLDPPPLGNVELKDAVNRVGNKIFLKGNIDSVNVLLRGSIEQIESTVRDCLSVAMAGGGYILSTACSVAPRVPADRVQLLAQLIDRYGIYTTNRCFG
jgi:hypothetical protein